MRIQLEPFSHNVLDCRDLSYTSLPDLQTRFTNTDRCPLVHDPNAWVGLIPFVLFLLGALWSIHAQSKR